MKISIIIPFHDEQENVVPVLSELRRSHPDAEIIAVDDGSRDATARVLAEQAGVRVIRLTKWLGQSVAIHRGLMAASGDVCVLIDGDGQSSTGDIKRLLEYIPEYDFVNGCRAARRDSLSRILASRFANWARSAITGDGMKDTGGTPKVMKRECADCLVLFDGMHRFLPAFMLNAGYRCIEVPVAHRTRLHGKTKYSNWRRGLRGIVDLVGVRWLLSRRPAPAQPREGEAGLMHFVSDERVPESEPGTPLLR